MSRTARWVLAIAALQAALVGVYWLVEHQRAPKANDSLGTEPPQRVDVPMPSLTVARRRESRSELLSPQRRTLVHVWATWCPPCRAELPGLLAVPSQHDLDVVAVALDRSWNDVDRFLGDMNAPNIVLAGSEDVERALGVRTLPVTFLVEADGRLTLRFDGARDWTDEAFVRTYLEERVDGR
jgi:thiol-disulfide isomerase/thioredoxin